MDYDCVRTPLWALRRGAPAALFLEEGLVLEEGDELFWVAGAAEGEEPRAAAAGKDEGLHEGR